MPKKSKRPSPSESASTSASSTSAPSTRAPDVETVDNLRYEDQHEDEFEGEDDMEVINTSDSDDDEIVADTAPQQQSTTTATKPKQAAISSDKSNPAKQAWTPSDALSTDETLEYDPSAYKMYHSLKPEWPSLTFDIVKDTLGENRSRFPHTVFAVSGSQADGRTRNSITVMKLSDMGRTYKKSEEDDDDDDDMSGSDSDSSDDEGADDDPILEHVNIPHDGCVNRIRSMRQKPSVVAAWSDTGAVSIFDISTHLATFDTRNNSGSSGLNNKPLISHKEHTTEGYGLDWSSVNTGHLLSGDCNGSIHYWQPTESSWTVHSGAKTSWRNPKVSVEDLQWSPSEGTVFASGDTGCNVNIYDTRKSAAPMLTQKAHNSDVNVISWNHLVPNLLASGSEDGVFSVWDLRAWGKEPLARFDTHTKCITSLEWHPTDESMIVVSDESAVFIYDLSIEEDEEFKAKKSAASASSSSSSSEKNNDIPPQLLFMHCGSVLNKEVHWHPQISSCVMTTALSGFNVFIPSNL